jgi:hypothetical protein
LAMGSVKLWLLTSSLKISFGYLKIKCLHLPRKYYDVENLSGFINILWWDQMWETHIGARATHSSFQKTKIENGISKCQNILKKSGCSKYVSYKLAKISIQNSLYSGLHRNDKFLQFWGFWKCVLFTILRSALFSVLYRPKYNVFRSKLFHTCSIYLQLPPDLFSYFFKTSKFGFIFF